MRAVCYAKNSRTYAGIFREYEKAIEGRYTDSEDYIDTIVSRIPEARFVAGRTIWIYGFDCFTPKNFDMIGELIRNAGDVNIVMTYDEGGNDARFLRLQARLLRSLKSLSLIWEQTCL